VLPFGTVEYECGTVISKKDGTTIRRGGDCVRIGSRSVLARDVEGSISRLVRSFEKICLSCERAGVFVAPESRKEVVDGLLDIFLMVNTSICAKYLEVRGQVDYLRVKADTLERLLEDTLKELDSRK